MNCRKIGGKSEFRMRLFRYIYICCAHTQPLYQVLSEFTFAEFPARDGTKRDLHFSFLYLESRLHGLGIAIQGFPLLIDDCALVNPRWSSDSRMSCSRLAPSLTQIRKFISTTKFAAIYIICIYIIPLFAQQLSVIHQKMWRMKTWQ